MKSDWDKLKMYSTNPKATMKKKTNRNITNSWTKKKEWNNKKYTNNPKEGRKGNREWRGGRTNMKSYKVLI